VPEVEASRGREEKEEESLVVVPGTMNPADKSGDTNLPTATVTLCDSYSGAGQWPHIKSHS